MASLLLGGLKSLGVSLLGDLGKSAMSTIGEIGKSQINKIGKRYGSQGRTDDQTNMLQRRVKGLESRMRNVEQSHKQMMEPITQKKKKLNEFERDDEYEE